MNVYLMDKMPPVDKKAEQVIETPFVILPGDEVFIDNFQELTLTWQSTCLPARTRFALNRVKTMKTKVAAWRIFGDGLSGCQQ